VAEPDEKIRSAYFDCENHAHRPWIIPTGYGFEAARIGYQMHKIPTCPARFIWRSSREFVTSPLAMAAIRYRKTRLLPGGVLGQPANVGYLVEVLRGELEAFRSLKSASKKV